MNIPVSSFSVKGNGTKGKGTFKTAPGSLLHMVSRNRRQSCPTGSWTTVRTFFRKEIKVQLQQLIPRPKDSCIN